MGSHRSDEIQRAEHLVLEVLIHVNEALGSQILQAAPTFAVRGPGMKSLHCCANIQQERLKHY